MSEPRELPVTASVPWGDALVDTFRTIATECRRIAEAVEHDEAAADLRTLAEEIETVADSYSPDDD